MDKELLELAAKAAGYSTAAYFDGEYMGAPRYEYTEGPHGWNPLTDDGDALRLAVKLRLQVTPGTYNVYEASVFRAGAAEAHEQATMGYGIEEATRRAIVRAAAEIGKRMP